ncbi:hypothetical protein AB6A40_006744 [Gnathostoma spinigerum]|uniref:DUF7153 domain-containing protein n=1 Tax=Gnathostoma spinigerum TaxID=75299 RepID=A0ABD6EKF7_9BILA
MDQNEASVSTLMNENGKKAMSDESILLGFIGNSSDSLDVAPCCSSLGSEFTPEDESLDKALADCHTLRAHPMVTEGVLLRCIDANPLFPYLHYAIFKHKDHEIRIDSINDAVYKMDTKFNSQFGAYDEIYAIHTTSLMVDNHMPSHRHAGYIVISFKLLEDESQHSALENSWLGWTGAREIYKHSPRTWNLRRLALYRYCSNRRGSSRAFAYVLMCEFASICHPSNRLQALDMCERLRVRNCGYVSLYQVQWNYNIVSSNPGCSSLDSVKRERNPLLRGHSQEVDTTTAIYSTRRNHPGPLLRGRSLGYRYQEEMDQSGLLASYQHHSLTDDQTF